MRAHWPAIAGRRLRTHHSMRCQRPPQKIKQPQQMPSLLNRRQRSLRMRLQTSSSTVLYVELYFPLSVNSVWVSRRWFWCLCAIAGFWLRSEVPAGRSAYCTLAHRRHSRRARSTRHNSRLHRLPSLPAASSSHACRSLPLSHRATLRQVRKFIFECF